MASLKIILNVLKKNKQQSYTISSRKIEEERMHFSIHFMKLVLLHWYRNQRGKKETTDGTCHEYRCFPYSSVGKESACNAGDLGLIPGLGRFPWRRERLPTSVFWPWESHGVAKSQTQLSNLHFHRCKKVLSKILANEIQQYLKKELYTVSKWSVFQECKIGSILENLSM